MKNVLWLLMFILLVPCFPRVGLAMRSGPQQMGEAHWKALRLLFDFLDKVKQADGPTPAAPSRDTDKPFKQWLSEGLKTGLQWNIGGGWAYGLGLGRAFLLASP